MRVVLDSNVLVSALVGHGAPRRLLFSLLREHVIVSSVHLLAELEDVLARKFQFSDGQIERIISLIVSESHLVEVKDVPKVVVEDPDDDLVLASAVEGESDFIVTGDRHLLRLREYGDIRIVTVREMLTLLKRG
jgi:putative PIN family toxin of toxin-antitoxin system